MRQHLKYFSYIFRHKLYVSLTCFEYGLYWRGLTHDLSKFSPSEWFPYANHDFDKEKDETGYYKPTDTGDAAFDFAWLLHQKRNDHHWQWWILSEDDGGEKIIAMSSDAKLEMICDWCGASKAQGNGGWKGVRQWYKKNKGKMRLHPDTVYWVEWQMKAIDEYGKPTIGSLKCH